MLWVTDDPIWGGYGPTSRFHLGLALKATQLDAWSPVRINIKTAHRQDIRGCHLKNFKFDKHDLSVYSQIWLFGIEHNLDEVKGPELDALARFMNNGGGVFATGDHENLGKALAGQVPRVRSMRRWFFPNPGPDGLPVAPSQDEADRLDTVVDTDPHKPGQQGDQSDSVPQTIKPRLYSRAAGAGILHRLGRYPHPVLCGPGGPIVYLPDHMHEGVCEVPSDLTRTFPLNGTPVDEYPEVDGFRQTPEVIAWATSHGTELVQFGVLAAYDGHAANVGRVFVDATWHHWFNVNLFGLVNASDPKHPAYDPIVVPKWEAIQTYYRNLPIWLADANSLRRIKCALWLSAFTHVDVRITYRGRESARDLVLYYWQLGTFMIDALRLIAAGCDIFLLLEDILQWATFRVNPWAQRAESPAAPLWLDLASFEAVLSAARPINCSRFTAARRSRLISHLSKS